MRRDTNTIYAVQISGDAIEDLGGNPFAGITDESSWDFTTTSTTYYEWIGLLDTDWNKPGNWSPNGVPYDTVSTDTRLTVDGTDEWIVFEATDNGDDTFTVSIAPAGGTLILVK